MHSWKTLSFSLRPFFALVVAAFVQLHWKLNKHDFLRDKFVWRFLFYLVDFYIHATPVNATCEIWIGKNQIDELHKARNTETIVFSSKSNFVMMSDGVKRCINDIRLFCMCNQDCDMLSCYYLNRCVVGWDCCYVDSWWLQALVFGWMLPLNIHSTKNWLASALPRCYLQLTGSPLEVDIWSSCLLCRDNSKIRPCRAARVDTWAAKLICKTGEVWKCTCQDVVGLGLKVAIKIKPRHLEEL